MMIFSKDIKEFTKNWKSAISQAIKLSGYTPTLGIIQVGSNEASHRYVKNKIADCHEVGILVSGQILEEDSTTEAVVATIKTMSHFCDGIIVQLPLPPQVSLEEVKKAIPAEKDVDGFTAGSKFNPCTPLGILRYLDYCEYNLDGKNVTILGRSEIVGKPLARMMTDKNATVTLCHSHTKNYYRFIQEADLIVCAVGKPNFLNCYPIHVPVIDVGINVVDGKLVGDCSNTENRDVTPVPGGVGLLTRCALLENVCRAANIIIKENRERWLN